MHNGDFGTVITVTIIEDGAAVDISAATAHKFILTRPDGSYINPVAVFKTDGTDGKLQYTLVSGDLNQAGKYSLQAKVTFASGTYYSEVIPLNVLPDAAAV